ncbi:unannotated protein [freshwater metagenome]|uniref:Unannotated protein n=1 Tax=freshwater metagenome TaxID=449393 RepID=A0A6J7F7S7_9ZZZZ
MIVFITTIRHPDNCTSYARVGRLLDSSLRSICNQTDDDLRVIVVHNSMPTVTVSDPRVSYVQVDFPAPSPERNARIPFNVFQRDKGTKCVVGVSAAQALGADHVMFFDADDYLHRGIAAFANSQLSHPGWYSPLGLIHSHGSRVVQAVTEGFHLKNGSTGIVRTDLCDVPSSLTPGSSQEDIVAHIDAPQVDQMFGGHGKWQDVLEARGHHMEPLPFPSAIWEIGTGENVSGNLVSARQKQALDDAISTDFSIELPSRWSHFSSSGRLLLKRLGRRIGRDSRAH